MSIDAYITARAVFVQENENVNRLATKIIEIGQAIQRRPDRFSFSNTGVGFPAEALMSRDALSADGNEWPSAESVNKQLLARHSAQDALRNAWRALSKEQQEALQPPPAGSI